MVPEKGILECARALAKTLPHYPQWQLVIAGAKRFEEARMSDYEKQIAAAVETLGDQVQMTGFIPTQDVRRWQA